MTIEDAFLKAIEVRHASPHLAKQVRRSLRKQERDGNCTVAAPLAGRRKETLYEWFRLGRRWAVAETIAGK